MNTEAIFDAALEALQPGREELARTDQTISLQRRKAQHLRRALATKEKAIEAARRTFTVADQDGPHIEEELGRAMRGPDLSAREEGVGAEQCDVRAAVSEVPV